MYVDKEELNWIKHLMPPMYINVINLGTLTRKLNLLI